MWRGGRLGHEDFGQGLPPTRGTTSQLPETEARFSGMVAKSKSPDMLRDVGGTCRVVHGAAEGEVRLHVPLQRARHQSRVLQATHEFGMVAHRVQDHEPMAGWRLRIRAIGPELRLHSGVIPPRHPPWLIRLAGGGIEPVAASPCLVELGMVLDPLRTARDTALTRRRDVHHDTVYTAAETWNRLRACAVRRADGRTHLRPLSSNRDSPV